MSGAPLAPVERAPGLVVGRYAPSPTGALHVGNARTALAAWLQVRVEGGAFLLRIEDIDRPREREGARASIERDLEWLGLEWDEGPGVGGPAGPYVQSERDAIYERALARLRAQGSLYRCVCTRRAIREAVASAPHGTELVYPGTCRGAGIGGEGAWRYEVRENVRARDELLGTLARDLVREDGDFAVRRRDGLWGYHLAVVVDDWLMGVTDVVRGADLWPSTPRQVALFEAFGAPVPRFWHVPMMLDGSGERMSKRNGAETVEARRGGGAGPETLIGELARGLGLWEGGAVRACELAAGLDRAALVEKLSRAGMNSPC